ncbi:MAG: hypothetical protein EAZ36_06475 [Verrucomicrobia bacterium]|nr:MAG: hypothetical protein EAZ36_06475 [Verrucomicrobiota bacterium]
MCGPAKLPRCGPGLIISLPLRSLFSATAKLLPTHPSSDGEESRRASTLVYAVGFPFFVTCDARTEQACAHLGSYIF